MSNVLSFAGSTANKELIQHVKENVHKNIKRMKEIKTMRKIIIGIGALAALSFATGIIVAAKIGKKGREELKDMAVDTVDTVNIAVHDEADMVKDTADKAAKEATAVIEEVNVKTEAVKNDVDNGLKKIKNDIKKTAKTITKDLKKTAK
jgi:gas vesicle protein